MSWTNLSGWALALLFQASCWVRHQDLGDRPNMLYNTRMMNLATRKLKASGVLS